MNAYLEFHIPDPGPPTPEENPLDTTVHFTVVPQLIEDETNQVLHECQVVVIPAGHDYFEDRFNWICSCGSRGQGRSNSDWRSVRNWFQHAFRAESLTYPRDDSFFLAWAAKEYPDGTY